MTDPKRKGIFFTSDWHIGHKNSLLFDSRPFRDLEHMHEALVNNYNSTVPEDGICYFLGDVGLCSGETMKKVIEQLRGTKVLILGNHDANMSAMYRRGFDVVLHSATLYIAGHRVTLSHCPLLGIKREECESMNGYAPGENWHGESRLERYSVRDEGQFHLHGHIHSPNRGRSARILDRQFDVGVPANGYRPVSISVIESWIAKYGRE